MLAAAVGILALPFAWLWTAQDRASRPLRLLIVATRCVLLTSILAAYAASWSFYALGGCFLDRSCVGFLMNDPASVSSFLLRNHPIVALGLPFLLGAIAIILSEGVPSWFARLPGALGWWIERAALAGIVVCLGLAVGGEMGRRGSKRQITDAVLEETRFLREVYPLERAENAGPLSHLLPWTTEPRPPFENGKPMELYVLHCQWKHLPIGFFNARSRKMLDRFEGFLTGPPPEMLRRPIVTMEQYLSTVDRTRLHRWNVILVLLDSFRSDSLQATGGPREIMPVLEALAREGSAFPDCYTAATHTEYAMPVAFSSHYPLRHELLYRHRKFPRFPRVLIYDVLKSLGWRTAHYSSQDENWGQLCDYYQTGGLDTFFHAGAPGGLTEQEIIRTLPIGSLDDGLTVTEALHWIDRRGDDPFFLSLILENCHLPFPVPADFPHRFGPPTLDFALTAGTFPKEKAEIAREVYANSLAYIDSQLGRLFDHLKKRGEWDRTLVVVSGDHGEAFYEHGMPAHANSIFDEAARVPLVIRAPGMIPTIDPRPAELTDIPPSVFHLLGLPAHPSFQGENLFAPDPRPDRIRYVLIQTGCDNHLGVIQSGFKLILNADSGRRTLFDLRNDPGEKTNVSAKHPEVLGALSTWMAFWRKAQLDYYKSLPRQSTEYPPVLRQP
jgi:arylsulfatase A-like enzyme